LIVVSGFSLVFNKDKYSKKSLFVGVLAFMKACYYSKKNNKYIENLNKKNFYKKAFVSVYKW